MLIKRTKKIKNLTLVSGPSKGGKSRWAENLLKDQKFVTYIATGANDDKDEQWLERIRIHKLRRPDFWTLEENSNNLPDTIRKLNDTTAVLIDSLGGFVYAHINEVDSRWLNISQDFINSIIQHQSDIVIVIEETGWGIVPSTSIGILFRDRIGTLAQVLESISNDSWLAIQGRAINLKKLGQTIPS